jgi:hypothetical protein
VTTKAAVAPSNTAPPTISGSPTAGSTLTANPGTWTGTAPIGFHYQWRICDGNGGACHDIANANSQFYDLKNDDAGNTVRIEVTAINADGSSVSTSVPSARIASAGTGPSNTAAPTISGTATTGSTLTVNNGTWSGTAPITFTYQWTICDGNGASCHDISGATNQTYTLKADDAGNTVRARVTAKNAAGTTAATTAPSASVGKATGGSTGGTACTPGSTQAVAAASVAAPERLQISQFQLASGKLTMASSSFSARFRITDTCGRPVSGALVDAAAVPYNQFSGQKDAATDSAGWVTLTFNRKAGYPASAKQQQLTMFLLAHKAGDPVLAGISTRRLIAFKISR